jgi:hypothetical protein
VSKMLTSILIDLAEVSVNVGSWTWNRGNTQLCFRCWTTWHGFSERLYPGKRSSTCPSCIFIANVLRCEGVAEDNCYAIPCEEREHFASPRTISWYARGRAPRFLKFYSRNRNDTFTWISYENNEVHRRRLADPESAHTFDIPDQANRLLLRSWMDECDTHRHSRAVDMGGNGRRQRVYNILLVDVRQKMLVGSRLLPEEKMPKQQKASSHPSYSQADWRHRTYLCLRLSLMQCNLWTSSVRGTYGLMLSVLFKTTTESTNSCKLWTKSTDGLI